jgi:hypothetical protein
MALFKSIYTYVVLLIDLMRQNERCDRIGKTAGVVLRVILMCWEYGC